MTIEPLDQPDDSGQFSGGDMVCAACGFVVVTPYKPIAEAGADAKK